MLLMLNLGLGIAYRLYNIPPIRWGCKVASLTLQMFLCVQVLFVCITLVQLLWSVICIQLCHTVAYVESNIDKATLAAVIRSIYLD